MARDASAPASGSPCLPGSLPARDGGRGDGSGVGPCPVVQESGEPIDPFRDDLAFGRALVERIRKPAPVKLAA